MTTYFDCYFSIRTNQKVAIISITLHEIIKQVNKDSETFSSGTINLFYHGQ